MLPAAGIEQCSAVDRRPHRRTGSVVATAVCHRGSTPTVALHVRRECRSASTTTNMQLGLTVGGGSQAAAAGLTYIAG